MTALVCTRSTFLHIIGHSVPAETAKKDYDILKNIIKNSLGQTKQLDIFTRMLKASKLDPGIDMKDRTYGTIVTINEDELSLRTHSELYRYTNIFVSATSPENAERIIATISYNIPPLTEIYYRTTNSTPECAVYPIQNMNVHIMRMPPVEGIPIITVKFLLPENVYLTARQVFEDEISLDVELINKFGNIGRTCYADSVIIPLLINPKNYVVDAILYNPTPKSVFCENKDIDYYETVRKLVLYIYCSIRGRYNYDLRKYLLYYMSLCDSTSDQIIKYDNPLEGANDSIFVTNLFQILGICPLTTIGVYNQNGSLYRNVGVILCDMTIDDYKSTEGYMNRDINIAYHFRVGSLTPMLINDSKFLIFYVNRYDGTSIDPYKVTVPDEIILNSKTMVLSGVICNIYIKGQQIGHVFSFFVNEGTWYCYDNEGTPAVQKLGFLNDLSPIVRNKVRTAGSIFFYSVKK